MAKVEDKAEELRKEEYEEGGEGRSDGERRRRTFTVD